MREKRTWLEPVLDALRTNPTLGGACELAFVEDVDHSGARLLDGTTYPGMTFNLRVLTTG